MTAPDPKTVREIAEDAIREGARTASIEDVLTGHPVVDHDDPESDYDAWFDAIAAQVHKPTVIVEWPDEQQPANVVTAEQQQGGVVEALRVWLASRTGDDQLGQDVRAALDNREAWRNLARSRGVERDAARAEVARAWEDLTTVREERTALAARVAELESERDGDLCILAAFLLPNRRPIEHWLAILANHFEARTNALMRDADRFAAARFRVDRVPAAAETEES